MIRNPVARTPASSAAGQSTLRRSIRGQLLIGAGVAVLLFGGLGFWAATAELSGAVIATGSIVADSRVKSVQHPTGGVVGEVLVEDGDTVKAGDLLVRLDDTLQAASLAIVTKEIDQLRVRSARLQAERDGASAIAFPAEIIGRADEPAIAAMVAAETKAFDMRRAARENLKAQLRERKEQLAKELAGYVIQADASASERALTREELAMSQTLRDQQLALRSTHLALQRNLARLEGIAGQIEASQAQIAGKITEIDLQILQIDRDLASEAGEEMRMIDRRIAELEERRIAGEDSLARTEIRAPQAGTIHQSKVHTVGGVIAASGEPIMLVVPEGGDFTVEARVAPQDIDQVKVGGPASLRFSAFNQRTTPEIEGIVKRVSADTSIDALTGASFYTVRIEVAEGQAAELARLDLVPGMPVEAFIRTGDRTALSYLMKPLGDQLQRAFRQE